MIAMNIFEMFEKEICHDPNRQRRNWRHDEKSPTRETRWGAGLSDVTVCLSVETSDWKQWKYIRQRRQMVDVGSAWPEWPVRENKKNAGPIPVWLFGGDGSHSDRRKAMRTVWRPVFRHNSG